MNTAILLKCIEEIKKDKPNLEYIRGILETIVEMSGSQVPKSNMPTIQSTYVQTTSLSDEEIAEQALVNKYESGPIGNLS